MLLNEIAKQRRGEDLESKSTDVRGYEMRIAVCDDQAEVLNTVERMFLEVGVITGIENVDIYQDIRKLKKEFQEGNRPDVLIMDICHEFNPALPKTKDRQEGIDCAYELNQRYPELQIIYMTEDVKKYSQDIFLKPVNLLGYLTKPVDLVILKKLLEIAKEKQKQNDEKRVTIMCRNHKQIFYLDEILYLESRAHRTMIHTYEGEEVCRDKISDLEQRMGDTFVRCHQSFLVNMKYIRRIENESFKLENGEEISISKRRYLETKNRYFAYLNRIEKQR